MAAERSNEKYILNSVDNALGLLNLFFDYEELSTNEIAKLLQISRSTAFRLVVTLEEKGFLAKTEHSTYRLGMNMFSLGMLAYNRMELVSILHPHLQRAADESGETCHLAMLEDGIHVTFIDRALGSAQLKMETAPGYRQFAHLTATGKAVLAFQSDQIVNEYIKKVEFKPLTPTSIKDAGELLRLLDTIRADGYAIDNEETEMGLTCYAMPILDASERAIAAISISGPTTRMQMNKGDILTRLRDIITTVGRTIK